MGLEGWVGQGGEPTGGLEELLTAVRTVGPEAGVEEAEEVVSKLAAVAAAVGVGQVLEQHRGKVAGYRPACMGCSVNSPWTCAPCQHIAAAKCVVSRGQAGQTEQCQTDFRQVC